MSLSDDRQFFGSIDTAGYFQRCIKDFRRQYFPQNHFSPILKALVQKPICFVEDMELQMLEGEAWCMRMCSTKRPGVVINISISVFPPSLVGLMLDLQSRGITLVQLISPVPRLMFVDREQLQPEN